MGTHNRLLPRPVPSRSARRYLGPRQPPACDLWARIRGAMRDFNGGTLELPAFHAIVRECLVTSADLTVAREISLPDAERINHLGAFALRQSRRTADIINLTAVDSSAGAATRRAGAAR